MEGHKTWTADTGVIGLQLLKECQPDVVLLDIGLPGDDGYQLAKRIKQLPNSGDPLLIAVTGYGQPADQAKAIAAGFDYHITKPFEMKNLLSLFPKS
jgi:CheY-like chemotaxis protein